MILSSAVTKNGSWIAKMRIVPKNIIQTAMERISGKASKILNAPNLSLNKRHFNW